MKRLFFILLLVPLLGFSNPPKKPNNSKPSLNSIIEAFEKQIAKDIADDNVNGSISAAIVHEDNVLWSKAFGIANINNNTFSDTNTIFRAGSITKPFTAFLMMQLTEEGVIKLDDPVEKYFKEVKNLQGYSKDRKITFRQLACHTSGLIREPKWDGAFYGNTKDWDRKVLLSIPKTSFKQNPNERFLYSNIGYAILGLALSKAAKKPYIELIQKKILTPLKMTNSFFIVPDAQLNNLAQGMHGYPLKGNLNLEIPAKQHAGRGYKVPNGGLYTTPNDLAKFMIANMGYSNILSKESLTQMQTTQTPKSKNWRDEGGIGFGFFENDSISVVEHGGTVAGYHAFLAFDKRTKYGIVIMRNYRQGITNIGYRSKVLLRKLSELE